MQVRIALASMINALLNVSAVSRVSSGSVRLAAHMLAMFRHRFEGFVSISQKWCHGKTQQGWGGRGSRRARPVTFISGTPFPPDGISRPREERTFHLRIEDIDPARCKPEFTDAILKTLRIGLTGRSQYANNPNTWMITTRPCVS